MALVWNQLDPATTKVRWNRAGSFATFLYLGGDKKIKTESVHVLTYFFISLKLNSDC